MNADDRIRLRHMPDAAREAIAFARGNTREDLTRDRKLQLSLVKEIEIVGEAANRVSAGVQVATPGVPWADIIGMRNRLIHAYDDVNLSVVWQTVTSDLPPLVIQLEQILAMEPEI